MENNESGKNCMKRFVPLVIAIAMTVILFWQFFFKGFIPISASFMAAWYEPWKTEYSLSGVPTIPHKAVGDDIFRQIYPMRTLASELLSRGQLPLWNPHNGAGQPLLATLHTGIANPFSLLQMRAPVSGWAWVIIIQVPLLFISMYWYLRMLGVSRFGSIVSGVVLSLSGVVTVRLIYADYVYALVGLPLLLGLVESATRGRRLWLYGTSFVVAYIIVAVQPQISVYIVLTYFLYTAIRAPRLWKDITLLFVLGVGISMSQMLPTLELYTNANVTSGSSEFIFDKFLMPISHFITLFIPNYFGNSGTYNFWGWTDYVETVMSMGLLAVVFAIVARFAVQKYPHLKPIVYFYYLAVGITLILTLSWWGTRMLYSIPVPVLSTSIPSRLYLLTSFYIAVLSGVGAQVWQNTIMYRKKTISTIVLVWIAAFGIVICTWILTKKGVVSCPSQVLSCMTVSFRNSVLELLVYSAGAVVLIVGASLQFFRKRHKFVEVIVVLILLSAGIYNAWKFLPMSPPQYVGDSVGLLRVLAEQSPHRVVGIGSAALSTDLATQHRFMDTNYYDPLYIRRYGELVSYVNTGDKEKGLTRSDIVVTSDATVSAEVSSRRERFWDMTGTSVEAVKKNEVVGNGKEVLWEDTNWMLRKRATAFPRAYLVSHVSVETNEDKELALLFAKETDLTKTAFVDTSDLFIPDIQSGDKRVNIIKYEPNIITINVETPSDAFLVLTDTYYPGWLASVDGKPTDIYRTNYAFRGVVVPGGKHIVIFEYAPDSWRYGVWISMISIVLWMVLVGVKSRKLH